MTATSDTSRPAPRPAAARRIAPPRRHRARNAVLFTLLGLLVVASVVLCASDVWLFRTWESLSADEVFYHLKVSLDGTNTAMIWDYLRVYGVAELLVCALVAAVLVALRRRPRALHVAVGVTVAASVAACAWALWDFDRNTGALVYLTSGGGADFIEEHYVDPASVDVEFPQRKRNLIYLFLESMEDTYADEASGGAFPRNCIPELTALAAAPAGQDFRGATDALDGALALPGCTWTMGGLFAQTSGLPLKLPLSGGAMEDAGDFFPGIVTLGDLLAGEGYAQELLIGSDAAFGGRDLYFTQHGGYALLDYPWALREGVIPADYKVFWGFEDEKLFDLARERATQLAAQGGPFNLTLLTVDTHFEDGYVCRLCGDEFGDDQYANVMACSSRQVTAFVQWVQEQPWGADTTVVICGDHTTMDSDFCADVPESYQRRTYTCIVNGAAQPIRADERRTYSTLDLFPTTLAALGATVPGDALGLGVNLYGERDTLLEELGVDACTAGLARQSAFMDARSGVAITEDTMRAVADRAELRVDPAEDGLTFVLWRANALNSESVLAARVTVTDDRTGESRTHDMTVIPKPTDPNIYTCEVTLPYAEADLEHLRARAYLTVEGFAEYPVAEFPAPEDDAPQG